MKLKRVESYDEFKVGQQVVFHTIPDYAVDTTAHKPYTIEGCDEDGDYYFTDDGGENNYAVGRYDWTEYGVYLILEEDTESEMEEEVERVIQDYGKHYRYSFRLNLSEEDIANGFVMVKVDPYRVSTVYNLGGWQEHLVKKTLRGTGKGHTELELIEELQCTIDRAREMYYESLEKDNA